MKIIVTADIHLDKYLKDNKYPGYRDEQFIRFANRLIEEAKLQDTKILFIAGDILDKSVNKPEVLHLLKDFLNVLSSYFDKVLYCLGNHDCNKRNNDNFDLSTYISLFNNDKFIYMNDRFIELNGKSIYFLDYQYEKHIEPKECDIFISHITIDDKFGQTVDNSKFKLGLFGDIHLPIDKGNYHTISSPLQRGFQDHNVGYFGVLDLDTLEYKRIMTDSDNYKFMKVRRQSDPDINAITDVENLFIRDDKEIESNKTVNLNDQEYILDKINNTKILEIIDNSIQYQYKSLHSQIKSKLNFTKDDEDINLDFKIKSIKINNFRSIENIEYQFDSNQNIYFVTGENGSGKTSFLRALYLSLYSDKELKSNKKLNSSGLVSTEIIFEYENKEYKIYRTEGKLRVFENDVDITPSGKNLTEKYLYDLFPFMNLLYIFYMQGGESFFDKINNIDVFNKLFNISYLTKFNELSIDLYKEESSKLSTINDLISKTNGSIEVIENDINDINDKLLEYKDFIPTENITDKINQLTGNIAEYRNKNRQLEECNVFLDNNTIDNNDIYDIEQLNKNNQELNDKIILWESKRLEFKSQYDKINELIKEKDNINKWIEFNNVISKDIDVDNSKLLYNKCNRILSKIKDRFNIINIVTNNLTNEINQLKKDRDSLIECPKCNNKFNPNHSTIENDIDNLIEELEIKLILQNKSHNKYNDLYAVILNSSHKYKLEIEDYTDNIKLISELSLKQSRLDEINKLMISQDINIIHDDLINSNDVIRESKEELDIVNKQIKEYNDNSKLLIEIKLKSEEKDKLILWFNANQKPDNELLDKLNQEQSIVSQINFYKSNITDKQNQLKKELTNLSIYNDNLNELTSYLKLIDEYKSLFDFNIDGSIPQKIFEYLSDSISDNQIKFSTFYYRNKLQIECSLKVDEEWINYDSLSMGQKSLIDMLLIKKFNLLLGNIGILFLDETLSSVDQNNYDELIDMIKDLNINDIFITSHLDKFNLYTKKLEFKRINNNTIII